ncbi:MAG: SIMPL domain-containing protein [Acetobacteraceae bacterium]
MRLPRLPVMLMALALGAPGGSAATLLRLSETARVSVPPDQLVASVSAQATAASAAAAQTAVNQAMTAALAAARKVAGVRAETGGYSTWQHPPGTPGGGTWQASAGLTLTSGNGAALLALVGRLQARGMAVSGLQWGLSGPTRRHARRAAMAKAIAALRGRAEQAAGLLGLRFLGFREVILGPPPSVLPRPMFAMARAVAPVAVGQAVTVSATVSAEATLGGK